MRDGVDVTLDQWDLKAGLNLNLFMESGLTESDRVLVVSSSNYVTKANGRTGGAGFEGNILSADMFNGGLHKDRIIPVIRNNPGGTVPTFLAGAVYVDMRDDSNHEEKYEDLLRTIHGIPKATKPQLGRNPYLRREGELYVPPSMSSSRYVAPAFDR
ncbi:TIR domain-containing protein [Rhodococcus hoagii]|nr:TIR domain-containing protein [Prescottella equi]